MPRGGRPPPIAAAAPRPDPDPALILEERVAFDRELSLISVRGDQGETRFYPLVENVHKDGILRTSRAPTPNAPQAVAESYATKILEPALPPLPGCKRPLWALTAASV